MNIINCNTPSILTSNKNSIHTILNIHLCWKLTVFFVKEDLRWFPYLLPYRSWLISLRWCRHVFCINWRNKFEDRYGIICRIFCRLILVDFFLFWAIFLIILLLNMRQLVFTLNYQREFLVYISDRKLLMLIQ